MKHLRIIDSEGETVSCNLTKACEGCLASCNFEGRQIENCPEYGGKRRLGVKITKRGKTFLCCDRTKTTRLFKEKIEALSYSFPELKLPVELIRAEEQKKVNRLVHNLTSINAHNIQEIYDLVPQEVLSQNWKQQIEYIKKEIRSDPNKTALMFLRIAKHNTHMKSEFSIYKKIERGDSVELEFREHNLRNVLLNTLHTFFSDFTRRDIYVEVEDFYFLLRFDYETIQVAFYHLLENASKYTLAQSKVTISALQTETHVLLKFGMRSANVAPNEVKEIMKEGVSGLMAKKMNKQGDGIGMWRINQMMKLNGGEFLIDFGTVVMSKFGLDFSDNSFSLKFKKQ